MQPAAGPSASTRRDLTIAAVSILAAAAVLRFLYLADKNIWLDEAASWSIVGETWPEFWRVVINDIHPPLYYLLLKGWVGLFGASEAGLRSLSVVAGIATVWLGWNLARRWLAPSVALAVMVAGSYYVAGGNERIVRLTARPAL